LRLFLAIALSPEARGRIVEEQALLRRQLEDVKLKWVPPENLHVTMLFFGEVAEGRLQELKDTLGAVSLDLSPLLVRYEGFGGFPFRRPRVLWAGARSNPYEDLLEMMRRLSQACSAFSVADERDDRRPHVTVARISGKATAESSRKIESALRSFEWSRAVSQEVTELTLYRSDLTKEGSRYEVVEVFPLGDAGRLNDLKT
jgi:RNA 2',3'-cyclic 3'-phosphodiesterase